jgi:hypothetical protein
MARLKDKIENGLNDVRILILGAQVLIGAAFRVFFEPDFPHLPYGTQVAQLVGLGLMILALGPLLLPAAFHQIVEEGEDTVRIKELTSVVLNYGLLPFAVGLAVGLFMVAQKISGDCAAWISALVIAGIALLLWYGVGYMQSDQSRKTMASKKDQQHEKEIREQGTQLTAKIKQLLTETRMVLPGTQALLGFQIIIFLMQDFDNLPQSLKWVHFGSLVAVSISAVLLIAPAAFHRIAEHGEDSERLHKFGAIMILMAMFFLGLGLAGDFFVITQKVSHSSAVAWWCSAGLLLFFYGLWFGYSGWKRWSGRTRALRPS